MAELEVRRLEVETRKVEAEVRLAELRGRPSWRDVFTYIARSHGNNVLAGCLVPSKLFTEFLNKPLRMKLLLSLWRYYQES